MMNETQLGVYSVAVTLAEIGQFVLETIAASKLPKIVDLYKDNKGNWEKEYVLYIEKIFFITEKPYILGT